MHVIIGILEEGFQFKHIFDNLSASLPQGG